MKRRLLILSIVSMLIFACNFPSISAAGVTPTAAAVSPTAPASATSPAVAPTALSTSSIPLAAPNGQPLNCRSGPGTSWSVVVVLNPGQTAEIVGKSPDGSWWYVKNPFLQGNFCWISADFTSTSGDLGGIPLAAIPPTLVIPTPVPAAIVVTDVSVSVSPTTIHVGGCMGPIQPSTISATITTSGAIKLQYHFETDQNGSLPSHSVKFLGPGSRDVSDSFSPPLTAGTYHVQLFIDGMDLSGMDTVATYKITC